MLEIGSALETDSATITLVADDLIEQHFKSGVRFDEDVLERNREAREELAQGKSYGLLIVLPEGVAVQPQSMNEDHFRWESDERRILAIAMVTDSADINAVSKFYFRYYAHAFEVKVFDEESEARDVAHCVHDGQGGRVVWRVDKRMAMH